MRQKTPPGDRRRRVSSLRLVVLVLPAILVVGCAGHDDGDDNRATPTAPVAGTSTPTRPSAPTPTPTVADIALAACQKLADCDQCFLNERGTCLDPAQCAARITEDEARCINSSVGCSQNELGNCLTVGCGGDGSAACE